MSTELNLGEGIHELVFTENATGCQDTVQVIVTCISTSTQEVELLVNTVDTLCPDESELLGPIIFGTNICPEASGEFAVFSQLPGSYCFEVSGVEEGVTRLVSYCAMPALAILLT